MMRKKIRVGILGSTGTVGQRLVSMLEGHPDFIVTCLSASKTGSGKKYRDAVIWRLPSVIPDGSGDLIIKEEISPNDCDIVISSLPSDTAGPLEERLRSQGLKVITNSSPHRMDKDVPLIIPEVNPEHIELVKKQDGFILANPNCSAIALTLALAPLHFDFGVTDVMVSTYQAISGAGYPGVSSMDIVDNLLPFIPGEEPKLESEPTKILGKLDGNRIEPAQINISSQCVRVNVTDGHLMTVSVAITGKVGEDDIINSFNRFSRFPAGLKLHTLPAHPLRYMEDETRPQPRLDRDYEGGMCVSIGRLRKCSVMDYKFVILGHNTVRGAAGAAIANAELCFSLEIV